jgi:hypothetical protein
VLYWRDDLEMEVKYYSKSHINVWVTEDGHRDHTWRLATTVNCVERKERSHGTS